MHTMNLSTVKWAQCDKTQSRELLVLFICALHCVQLLHTILHRTDLIIFPVTLQTTTISVMMSFEGKGVHLKWDSNSGGLGAGPPVGPGQNP